VTTTPILAAPRRWSWPWLVLGVAAWFALTIGVRPLALPDEGRYVGVAWEMIRSGDWTLPTLDGMPFFHKPPLFYWITAAALSVGGVHPGVARVAPWLAALLSTLALYAFARRWCDESRARAAVLVLATLPLFYGASQYANLDMLVAGCISIAVLALAHVVLRRAQGENARATLFAAYVAMGLGMLAKGLIGIVLPALVIGVWTLALQRSQAWRTWIALLWWPGPVVLAVVVAPWFVAMQQRFPGFVDYFFMVQHVKRFAAGGFNNVQPFWFYFAVLSLLCLPWVVWAWCWRHKAFWRDPGAQPVRLLMAVWLASIVLFFSWPQSKLVGYILPTCVPLAFLLADAAWVARASGHRVAARAWTATLVVSGVLCPVLVTLASRLQAPSGAELALALAPARTQGDPVVFVDRYAYDVPMLSGIDRVWVSIDDWSEEALAGGDSWRNELADAARFARPDAAQRLVAKRDLPARLCGASTVWFVAPLAAPPPWLAGLAPVTRHPRLGVWRLSDERLRAFTQPANCPRTPNDAPASR
jgi:4-amino-4-deoxy-L-arabinose transferase-like glycosyltransferase